MAEHGPFQAEADVLRTEAVRAVFAAFDVDPGAGKMKPHNLAMLTAACEAAGVELGEYDLGILAWLAAWEPQTVAVIAGIIRRAAQPPEGTFTGTQWPVRYSDQRGVLEIAPYDDEADAREHTQGISPPLTATVVSRRRWWTRWTEAPETTEVTALEDGDDG